MDELKQATVTLTLESDLSLHLSEEDQTALGVRPGDRLVIQREVRADHVLISDRAIWERFSVVGDSPYVVNGELDWQRLREDAEADAADEYLRKLNARLEELDTL